jgi:hypothetical protein
MKWSENMYIYEVTNYYYDENTLDNIYGFSYVVHKDKFTAKEFRYLCENALSELGRKDAYGDKVVKYLIDNYGFENMPIETRYEYDVDEE